MSSSSTFAVAHVFYVDHQGHPAPLSLTYHATASRRLSSSVDRYPRATITEVDSAYCPQCLAYLDTPTASRLAYCPKPTCQRCPMCQSVAIITARENLCFYQCGRCDWDSRAGQLQVQLMTDDDEPTDRLALARAAEDLHSELKHKKEELCKPLHTYFNKVRDYWARDTDEQIDLASRNISSDGWSMEALESKLATKSAERESIQTLDGFQVQRLSLDDEVPELETLQSVPELSFQLQSLNSCHIPEHRKDLLPLPTPLRVRFSRRCRAELAAGRPGILLKPKLDPLDGDSSLRSGDGRWMKKVRT
jgi:dynactin-4